MNIAFNSAAGLEGQRVVGDKNGTGYQKKNVPKGKTLDTGCSQIPVAS